MMRGNDARKSKGAPFNFFDLFLVLLVILAGLSVYFTLVHPLRFSHLINREDSMRYAEVEIVLPDDVFWIKDVLPVGEELRNIYGQLEWKILETREMMLGDRKWAAVKAEMLVNDKGSGVLSYGKYTLARGSVIYLINDRYGFQGHVYNYRVLNKKISL
jgi:hypothetical protein